VYLNGRFDQAIGGGYTQAILYVDAGVLNTIEDDAARQGGLASRRPDAILAACLASGVR
jgi:hypothetical protein